MTEDGRPDGGMGVALALSDVDAVRRLLQAGADPNAPTGLGQLPIHVASMGTCEMAALLIEHGADVDAGADQGFPTTGLYRACLSKGKPMISLLLRAGASPALARRCAQRRMMTGRFDAMLGPPLRAYRLEQRRLWAMTAQRLTRRLPWDVAGAVAEFL